MTIPRATSGSREFDLLRERVLTDRQLRNEIESLMLVLVETFNPSDRGNRFIVGTIGEWLIALSAYAAGAVSVPAGHNADGFDLEDVHASSKQLWSVKSSYARSGEFIISNGRDGAGRGLVHPTLFWAPTLPGIVYVNPEIHQDVVESQRTKKDSVELPKRVVRDHAQKHPECCIEVEIPVNPKTGQRDTGFEAVRSLIHGGNFPRLRKMFDDSERSDTSVVGRIKELIQMREKGQISSSQFDALVDKISGAKTVDTDATEPKGEL